MVNRSNSQSLKCAVAENGSLNDARWNVTRSGVAEPVLWAILHVEYNGDGLLAIWVHLGEPSYKARSRSCQKFQILKCLILKNRPVSDAEWPQKFQWCHLFFLYVV